VPQPAEGVSHAAKVEVADAEIRWAAPAFAIDRLVRGCTPAPGAWTTFRGERLKVGPIAEADPTVTGLAPGRLHVTKNAVHVGTATDAVRLGDVRPHGKKQMDAADWARGVRIDEGEVLGG
jgi:methionyl-tRNA formyltransferase